MNLVHGQPVHGPNDAAGFFDRFKFSNEGAASFNNRVSSLDARADIPDDRSAALERRLATITHDLASFGAGSAARLELRDRAGASPVDLFAA